MYTKEKIEKDKDALWKIFCIAFDTKQDVDRLKSALYVISTISIVLNISFIIVIFTLLHDKI